ncbi:MAG: hypothetical protein KUG74_02415 [Rhodobacteraceae bacterium]|nr:hypothetical protein [Paracoccaceae bacterium]
MKQTAKMYYFRGTTLQTDDIPIIQYLAYDDTGQLLEKVDIYHDGRCRYLTAEEAPLSAGAVELSEVASNWSYGDAAKCSGEEFEAMKQLALAMAKRNKGGRASKEETRPKALF